MKAFMPFTTPSRFTLITQSQIFFGVPMVEPPATPALLKITWTAPNSFSAASRSAWTSDSWATSQCTPITVAPWERISSTWVCNGASSMSPSTMFAPAFEN